MIKEERFLSRKFIYPALYGLFIAFVAFIAGIAYQRYSGPQKVIVDSESTRNKPLYVQLKDDSVGRSTSRQTYTDVTKELKSLGKRIEDVRLYSKYIGGDKASFNSRSSMAFKLPKNIKGYYLAPLTGIIDATCVPSELKRGDPLIVSFFIRDKSLIAKSSPLFLRVVKKVNSSELQQIIEEQYEIKEGQNNVLADVDLAPGEYEMSYGYYFLKGLSSEYPNYYGRVCRFSVLKGP